MSLFFGLFIKSIPIMAILKPFTGLRPPVEIAKDVASKPYDVIDSDEARVEAKGNPYSLLHIVKPEIDCPPETGEYDQIVYDTAKRNFEKFCSNGWLVPDNKECLYIYALIRNGKRQYGVLGGACVEDFDNQVIREHELTRKDKEDDRTMHIETTNANLEPVYFTYRAVPLIDEIVASYTNKNTPVYDFTADDGVGHQLWVIDDMNLIERIVNLFKKVPNTYVADGHHRSAAAVRVAKNKRNANPDHTGNEEYNYFMAIHFPDSQLSIIDYNRVVKDLNGLDEKDFLEKLREVFIVEEKGKEMYKPDRPHNFSLYLGGNWYSLTAREEICNDDDPIDCLDVALLSEFVLDKILDIKDLRTDKRIDFVGGVRGLGELKKRVDSGEMQAAFAMYPVTMKQLMDIADTGNIMPPKTTWFDPKPRSGLVIHLLDRP